MLIIGSTEYAEKSKEGKLFTLGFRVNRKQFSKIWYGFFIFQSLKVHSLLWKSLK